MRCFFDTNILVYAHDPGDAAKRTRARALIGNAIEDESFVVSSQVLAEFYAATLRRRFLTPELALDFVRFWGSHDTVPHSADLVARGIELHQAHALSIWDGFIVQAALDARCDVLFSEDLQHGRRFGSLEVVNPFLSPAAHESGAPRYGARKSGARPAPGSRRKR